MTDLDEFTERHFFYPDYTARDYIEGAPDELDLDGVSLANIIENGRVGFRLDGPKLVRFVACSIRAFLEAGAVPARLGSDPDADFTPVAVPDSERLGLVQAILKQWQDARVDPPQWDDTDDAIWFYRFDEKPPPQKGPVI